MTIMPLLVPQVVITRGEKMAQPITLPDDGQPAFLLVPGMDELSEIDRQNLSLKRTRQEILQHIFAYGCQALSTLNILSEHANGRRPE